MPKTNRRRKQLLRRQITLSEAAGKLATDLAVIACFAEDDCAESVRHYVTEMIALVNACATPMKEQGDTFAAVGSPSEIVAVAGRSYASAHQAAFNEAMRFLDWLWFCLDEDSRRHRNDWCFAPTNSKKNAREYRDSVKRSINSTGLDPELVVDNWEIAKVSILERLTPEWQQGFKHIQSRIARESAAIEHRRKSQPFVPNDFQHAILKALDGRALKKQPLAEEVCGGEGSRLYRPGGLKELMNAGKVSHKHRLRYFRPDALPPPL
jgi:hypothetical protein